MAQIKKQVKKALRELLVEADKCLKIQGNLWKLDFFRALPFSICFDMFISFSICLLHVFFTVRF